MSDSLEVLVVALDGAVPSVVDSLMRAGRLPAFKALSERGVWLKDCRPPFPTITPACWSSFATGATPATHGATCQDIHLPGMKAGDVVSAYHSQNITAERFWEAAARAGKRSLIMQLPASGPARSDDVLQVAGAACAAIRAAHPARPTVPSEAVIPALLVDSGSSPDAISWLHATPGSGQWQPSELGAADASISATEDTLIATVTSAPSGGDPVVWTVAVMQGQILVGTDDGTVTVRAGSWSPPFARRVKRAGGSMCRCWFRIRLFASDPETRRLRMFITESGPASGFASPAGFAAALDAIPLVPANHGHSGFLSTVETAGAYLEAERHNFEWQLAALDAGTRAGAPHIAVVYSVYLDSMNHAYRNVVEGLTDSPAGDREAIVELYHRGYELADWFLSRVLERAGETTTIAVVSDHGSVGYTSLFDPVAPLEQAGLVTVDRSTDGIRRIDHARSLVFPISTCHVYVNLKDREPDGIVEPADYERVVQRTITALLGATAESGETPVAFAVRRAEAGFVGLGGERVGDVVYGIRGGRIGGHIGGVHACQIPTAVSETGDIRSLCILAGPRFVRNLAYPGPAWLWDLAPTLAHALSYPLPAQSEGRVIHQILAT